MTERQKFTLTFCISATAGTWLVWLWGFGFTFQWVLAIWILVPACAYGMPDRERKDE